MARYVANRARRLYAADGASETIALNINQAQAFLSRFDGQLSATQQRLVQDFAGIRERGAFSRRWSLIRNAFWKRGLVRNLGKVGVLSPRIAPELQSLGISLQLAA